MRRAGCRSSSERGLCVGKETALVQYVVQGGEGGRAKAVCRISKQALFLEGGERAVYKGAEQTAGLQVSLPQVKDFTAPPPMSPCRSVLRKSPIAPDVDFDTLVKFTPSSHLLLTFSSPSPHLHPLAGLCCASPPSPPMLTLTPWSSSRTASRVPTSPRSANVHARLPSARTSRRTLRGERGNTGGEGKWVGEKKDVET